MMRDRKRNAKSGNLLASFALYLECVQSPSDEKREQAEQWFNDCWYYLQNSNENKSAGFTPKNKFYLRSMILDDFRCFSYLDIQFESDLTVIIGNNGQGKSSILLAIAKTLSWFSANILKEDGSGQRFSEITDIKNDSNKKYTDVITQFYFGQGLKNISARLSRSAFGKAERREGEVKEIKTVADIWRVINDKKAVNLPNFQFFSVERSQPLGRLSKDSSGQREARFDAYNHALAGGGRIDHFIEWFIALHKKTVNHSASSIDELTQHVTDLRLSIASGLSSLRPLLEKAEEQLQYLLLQSQDETKQLNIMQKEMVVKAICNTVPSISNLWVETLSGSDLIKITNDNEDVTIEQLSDGQRIFLVLVADIARRMVMLNPLLANPLEGQGIILIDEIELHLHPKWQQSVIQNLRSTFPNIQFIITTHSPIVLSTVDKRCIRMFSGNKTLIKPEFQTQGVINSDILEQIMGVFATPPQIPQSHWVSEFDELIEKNGFEDNKFAKDLYEKIKDHFGENSVELKKCDSLIRIRKMKQRVLNKNLGKGN